MEMDGKVEEAMEELDEFFKLKKEAATTPHLNLLIHHANGEVTPREHLDEDDDVILGLGLKKVADMEMDGKVEELMEMEMEGKEEFDEFFKLKREATTAPHLDLLIHHANPEVASREHPDEDDDVILGLGLKKVADMEMDGKVEELMEMEMEGKEELDEFFKLKREATTAPHLDLLIHHDNAEVAPREHPDDDAVMGLGLRKVVDMEMDGKVMEMEAKEELDEFLKLKREATRAPYLELLINHANAEVAPRENSYNDDDDVEGLGLTSLREHPYDEAVLGLGLRGVPKNIRSSYHVLGNNHSVLHFAMSRCNLSITATHDFILNACFSFPRSLPDRLPSLAKFSIWLFFFDDLFDIDSNRLAADPHVSSIFVSAILRALTTSSLDSDDIHIHFDDDKIDGALLDDVTQGAATWWGEFQKLGMPPAQQRRFLGAFTSYAASIHRKTRYRFSGSLPSDLRSYAALRADASCVFCFNVLAEFSMGMDVMSGRKPELRRALESLGRNAVLETVWFNDLRSLAKEMEEGDFMNLVPYLYVQEKKGKEKEEEEGGELEMVEKALKVAGRMVRECRVESKRLVAQIQEELLLVSGNGCHHNNNEAVEMGWPQDIRLYLKALDSMVAGLQLWHDHAMRYRVRTSRRRRRGGKPLPF